MEDIFPVTIYPGTIFPRIFFPGTISSGTFFPRDHFSAYSEIHNLKFVFKISIKKFKNVKKIKKFTWILKNQYMNLKLKNMLPDSLLYNFSTIVNNFSALLLCEIAK